MAVTLSGNCVEIERKPSTSTDADGVVTKGILTLAYILDGRYVRNCVVGDEYGVAPVKGEDVDAEVIVSINREGRFPSLNWRLVAPVAAPSRLA